MNKNNMDYNENVKDHFLNPRNMGELKDADAIGKIGNPKCGDVMQVAIKVRKNRIEDIKFLTFGCAAAIATSSAMTELAKGKKLDDAKKIKNSDVAGYLGGLPLIKTHCSNLAADALVIAIRNFEESEKLKDKL
jgi:nitrogen fixation protein NifU and related proteins